VGEHFTLTFKLSTDYFMKSEHLWFTSLAALLLSSFILHPSSLHAQGSLTPPGAPAPTMITLNQIEPRTPISSAPYTITQPGSYYLVTNLYIAVGDGIAISANNVTLDLNGFTVAGNSPGLGVDIGNAQTNVIVRNRLMSGWYDGVLISVTNSRNIVLERLVISGSPGYGIYCSCPAVVRDCLCVSNNGSGIFVYGGGQITDCDAGNNGQTGINVYNGIVRNCRAANNASGGILVAPGTVSGCWVQNNGDSGIYLGAPGSEAIGNTCIGNNTNATTFNAGIFVGAVNNRVEDNHVSASGYAGISVNSSYSGNIIVKNFVSGNGANNYLTPGNQVVGPLITTYGTITNSNPWANFSF
jgi:Right handed beta helix region